MKDAPAGRLYEMGVDEKENCEDGRLIPSPRSPIPKDV